jgi:hypothetical protein
MVEDAYRDRDEWIKKSISTTAKVRAIVNPNFRANSFLFRWASSAQIVLSMSMQNHTGIWRAFQFQERNRNPRPNPKRSRSWIIENREHCAAYNRVLVLRGRFVGVFMYFIRANKEYYLLTSRQKLSDLLSIFSRA